MRINGPKVLICFVLLSPLLASGQVSEPNGAGVEQGTVPEHWPASGPKCMEVPDWQVHEYNRDTYIIRQSGCLDYEKPFLYMLFGKDRALLIDTGSRNFPAAAMVKSVAGKWMERNGRQQLTLVAVHSHPHGDHVWGDAQLRAFSDPAIHVQVIAPDLESTKKFFGVSSWPDSAGSVDLGRRVLDMIPIPGHSNASIALYDRNTGILFTGDSLYPGRLYVSDWDDFVKSTHRLVEFTQGKVVTNILGNHIEQTDTAYLDYPIGTIYQPHEHSLALSRGALLELDQALRPLNGKPARLALRDFTIWPSTPGSFSQSEVEAYENRQKQQMWDQPLPQLTP